MAVIFTYILFDGDKDAMRFAWNMAENYVTGYDTFVTYCKQVKKVRDKFNSDENIAFYKTLSENDFSNPSEQLTEEITKAKQILNGGQRTDGKTWEDIIIKAEQSAFFKGAIRFLFTKENIGDDWNDFDTKWGNAQRYFEDKELQEDRILQYFISCCENIDQMKEIVYDSKATTWESNLLNVKLLKVTNDFLLNTIPGTLICGILEAGKPKEIQEDLVLTNLLFNLKYNNWPVYGCELRYMNGQYALLPSNAKSDQKKYVVANIRNEILSSLIRSKIVSSNQKLEDCDFFFGWDIKFIYRGKKFQWYRNDIVYIMKDKDPTNGFMDKDKKAEEETQKYYCFSASNTSDFTRSLDCLIAQAYPEESDKKCCDDCQNKVCE